uniref:Uncharacterized protein n=1 Tax=Candidatus Kentrum sp. FW TaxID=2126338 RepID=A0A450SRV7_9GAMM|nr:MAG: hypothetical protein BECKFW1821B_GA0114236_102839 [Candidatus Kentron sp. FW]
MPTPQKPYYFPEVLGIVVALLLLNLWYLSGLAIENKVIPTHYDYVLKFVTIATGAFIGAFSAFALNAKTKHNDEQKIQKAAINKALFTILRQRNAIKNIVKEYNDLEHEYKIAFNLPAKQPPDYSKLYLDTNELSFLLETQDPNMLMELSIEQERFEQVLSTIKIRNEFYVNEVQPALHDKGLIGRIAPIQEYEALLGERVFKGALLGARNMVFHANKCDKSLAEIEPRLYKLAKAMFPNEKFVQSEKA